MKKKMVEDRLYDFGEFSIFSDSIDVEYIEQIVKEQREDYPDKYESFIIRIEGSNYSDESINLFLVGIRSETDDEYDERLKKCKRIEKEKTERERKQYEILRAKFEKGN